jgi:hypothetical protein
MTTPYSVLQLDEVEAIDVAGVHYVPLRHELGTTGFSINAFRAEDGELLVEEHDETGDNAGRQEELYAVVAGHATFTVAGREIDAPAGTLVFVRDPATRRAAMARAPGTVALAIGGRTGTYEASPFEFTYRAQGAVQTGDHAGAITIMEAGHALHPGNAAVLYNLACYEALGGRHDDALRHLARATELDPHVREWAASDADFDAIRADPRFPR